MPPSATVPDAFSLCTVLVTLALSLLLAAALRRRPRRRPCAFPVANVWEAPNAGHLPLDPHVWPTSALTVTERRALVGHMPTQALYGERVLVLARRPGWTRIAIPDQPSPLDRRGYPGWVRTWQLGPAFAAPLVVTSVDARLANGTEVGLGSQVPAGAVAASATRGAAAHAYRPRAHGEAVRRPPLPVGRALGVGLRLLRADLGRVSHARNHDPARRRRAVRRRPPRSRSAMLSPVTCSSTSTLSSGTSRCTSAAVR